MATKKNVAGKPRMTKKQLDGATRRDIGRRRAIDHAGDTWKEAGLAKLRKFLSKQGDKPFAFETFRAWAINDGLELPPDHHAWGGLATSAIVAGLVKHTGRFRPAMSPATHRHPVRLLVAC